MRPSGAAASPAGYDAEVILTARKAGRFSAAGADRRGVTSTVPVGIRAGADVRVDGFVAVCGSGSDSAEPEQPAATSAATSVATRAVLIVGGG